MGVLEEYRLDCYQFDNKYEYEQAKLEWDTICNLDKQMNLGDPKAALSLYNQAVSKRSFKTPVGYEFLKRLRGTIVSCGLAAEEDLNMIPVVSSEKTGAGMSGLAGRTGNRKKKQDVASVAADGQTDGKLTQKFEKEKKTRIALTVAVVALTAVIISMFILTMNSKYSYLTYFTDYENDIRESVIDEYEEWEKELDSREKALNDAE